MIKHLQPRTHLPEGVYSRVRALLSEMGTGKSHQQLANLDESTNLALPATGMEAQSQESNNHVDPKIDTEGQVEGGPPETPPMESHEAAKLDEIGLFGYIQANVSEDPDKVSAEFAPERQYLTMPNVNLLCSDTEGFDGTDPTEQHL